jgi:ankyrin repeat protein
MDIYELCRDGDVDTIEKLLSKAESRGYDVLNGLNKQNCFGRSPLHIACRFGQLECVTLLLKYNINLDLVSNNGYTILHDAAVYRQSNVLKYLLVDMVDEEMKREIAKLATSENKFGSTPLHLAIKQKDMACVEILYPFSTIGAFNMKEQSYLHVALAVGKPRIAKFIFLAGGCDSLKRDRNEADCIHYITMNESGSREFNAGLRSILKMILDRISVTITDSRMIVSGNRDKYNNTPLHYAAISNQLKLAKDLIAFYHKFESKETLNPLTQQNSQGQTPMDLASPDLIEYIKKWYLKRKYPLLLQ